MEDKTQVTARRVTMARISRPCIQPQIARPAIETLPAHFSILVSMSTRACEQREPGGNEEAQLQGRCASSREAGAPEPVMLRHACQLCRAGGVGQQQSGSLLNTLHTSSTPAVLATCSC